MKAGEGECVKCRRKKGPKVNHRQSRTCVLHSERNDKIVTALSVAVPPLPTSGLSRDEEGAPRPLAKGRDEGA